VNFFVIRVRFHGRPRANAGLEEVEVTRPVRTFRDLLDALDHMLGEGFSRHLFDPGTRTFNSNVILLVNGHSIKMLEGLETPLLDKDTVTIDSVDILEIVGGG
jgi:molybdopterin converting factor small subunit